MPGLLPAWLGPWLLKAGRLDVGSYPGKLQLGWPIPADMLPPSLLHCLLTLLPLYICWFSCALLLPVLSLLVWVTLLLPGLPPCLPPAAPCLLLSLAQVKEAGCPTAVLPCPPD